MATELNNDADGVFGLNNVEHVFLGEGLKVEAIAGVVVGGHRLGVGVDHDGLVAVLLQRKGGVAAAVVELNALADAVGAAAQDHHLGPVGGQHLGFVFVGGVVVGGKGLKLGGAGVYGFVDGDNAQALAVLAHGVFVGAGGVGNLAIAKALALDRPQLVCGEAGEGGALEKFFGFEQAAELVEKPGIDGGELVDLVHGQTELHGVAQLKDALGVRGAQLGANFVEAGQLFGAIAAPPGSTRLQRSQRLLEGFLERAPDRHRFAHRLHLRRQRGGGAGEFFKGKAGNLGHHVVDGGLKAGRGFLGDVVGNFVEGVAHRQLGRKLSDRKARRLRSQGRAPRHPRIHLDHNEIAVVGVDGKLNIRAAGLHPDLTDDLNRGIPQPLVLLIGQGLGRGHGNRIAGMYPHGV